MVGARQLSVAWGSTTAGRLTRDERAGLAITDAANETITWTKNGEVVDAVSDVGVAVGSTDVYKASAGAQTATIALSGAPSTPTIGAAVAGPGSLSLSWTCADDAVVTFYEIDVDPSVALARLPLQVKGTRDRRNANTKRATVGSLPVGFYKPKMTAVANGVRSDAAVGSETVEVSEPSRSWPPWLRWLSLIIGVAGLGAALALLIHGPVPDTREGVRLETWGLVIGALLTLGAVALLLAARRPSDLLSGDDGRISTSKTNFALWTVVVVFGLATLIAMSSGAQRFGRADPCNPTPERRPERTQQVCIDGKITSASDLRIEESFDDSLAPNYLVLLGGPFVGLVGARWIVNRQVARGDLQKVSSFSTPSFSEALSNDAGDADLADGQYLLFSVVLLLYFLANFIPAPYKLPDLPWGLVGLTGLSAGAYLVRKGVTTNGLTVDGMVPTQVSKQQLTQEPRPELRVVGRNFLPPGSDQLPNGGVAVMIGSTPAVEIKRVTDSEIVIAVPATLDEGNYDVQIATGADALGSAGILKIIA